MDETKQIAENSAQTKQNVVSREMASNEVHGWLKARKIRQRRINDYEESIEEIIDAVVDGEITFDGDNLIFHLTDGVGDQQDIKKLTFKPRITVQNIRQRLKKVPSGDVDGRVMAYVGSATNTSKNVLEQISSTDWSLIQTIAVFFM